MERKKPSITALFPNRMPARIMSSFEFLNLHVYNPLVCSMLPFTNGCLVSGRASIVHDILKTFVFKVRFLCTPVAIRDASKVSGEEGFFLIHIQGGIIFLQTILINKVSIISFRFPKLITKWPVNGYDFYW